MRKWRKWGLNAIICMMGTAAVLQAASLKKDAGRYPVPPEGTEELAVRKSSLGLIETVGELLKQGIEGQNTEEEKILGGASLTLLSSQTGGQMLSAVIQTKDGGLIVVDGGNPEDADHLTDTLIAKGGHVKAWLITHPHIDHIGALNTILCREESRITIDNIYYSFAPVSHYEKDSSASDITVIRDFIRNLEMKVPPEKLNNKIKKGTQIQVDDVTITVLNKAFQLPTDSINNSSVCYMINVNGVYIDFLGDLGRDGGEKLINSWDTNELHCDILQVAHHGQNGVDERVYQVFRPEICLWPTPQWLWDNDGGYGPGTGKYRIADTKKWLNDLGVKKHYCMKDGDQVIE